MSYVRFSSDDFLSDVYVYADISGGWTTHVAQNHLIYQGKLPPPVDMEDFETWQMREEVVRKMRNAATRVEHKLAHAGETFNDPTPGACANRLKSLRELGYHVPQDAIDALEAEERGE